MFQLFIPQDPNQYCDHLRCTKCHYRFHTFQQFLYHIEHTRSATQDDRQCHECERVPFDMRLCHEGTYAHFLPRKFVEMMQYTVTDTHVSWGNVDPETDEPIRYDLIDVTALTTPIHGSCVTMSSTGSETKRERRIFDNSTQRNLVTYMRLKIHWLSEEFTRPTVMGRPPNYPPMNDVVCAPWLKRFELWPQIPTHDDEENEEEE